MRNKSDVCGEASDKILRAYALPHAPVSGTHLPSPILDGVFIPELALQEASTLLRRKNSINYELFRAIVLNGGRADTQTVKRYLLEHDIRQPGSGENFERVALTDISSRVNYLVRKGVVTSDGHGSFVSRFGWSQGES
jgi:hypothetical protein